LGSKPEVDVDLSHSAWLHGLGYGCLGTVLGYVSGSATKEANVVIELTLMFLRHQFTVFSEF